MLCCGTERNPLRVVDILRAEPEPCNRHKKPIKFVCRTCPEQALLCEDCILDHQGHDWISLANFINDDVVNLFETGKSKSGQVVEQFVDRVVSNLVEFQQRIQQKMKIVIASIMIDLEKLKAKFPKQGGYIISGTNLNHKNIRQVNAILSNEKYIFDTTRIQRLHEDIVEVAQQNINQLLDKVKQTLCWHDWDLLEQRQISKIENNFMGLYRKLPPNRKFLFSLAEKSKSIDIINNKLTAVYHNELPRCPVVLLDKFLRQQQHTVSFKITKLLTHAYFFNMSVVYIGICNPTFAQGFGYTDLARPSKGAYMISSAGRCYHSKLPEYDDKRISFGFGAGDIITLDLNIANKTVSFQKRTKKIPFGKVVDMPLGLQPKFIDQLKPFVMFSSQPGTEVTILNETELLLQLDGKQIYKVKQQ